MPDWKTLIHARLASLSLGGAREAEIVEEMVRHAEDRFRELQSGGMSEEEARQTVLEEIGDVELQPAEMPPASRADPPDHTVWGGGLLADLRYGIRNLRKSPAWTLVVVAVLGIGIGANVAMFTVFDAAFLRPLRFPEPERLVQIQESRTPGEYTSVSYPNFVDWEKQSRSFESMGVAAVFPETLKGAGGNQRVQVAYVSPGLHRALGVKVVKGRLFSAADDTVGAPPVVLLSHSFWQSRFGGDPGIIGHPLILGDRAWSIAGVLAPFRWQRTADVFVPVAFALEKWTLGMRENRSNSGVTARMRPGVTIEQARAEMQLIATQLAKQYPGANAGVSAVVVPLGKYISGSIRQAVLLVFGAVGLLLLIACANVAGLQLARAAVRRREMAIRIALGAGRLQLIRQLLTESLLLAVAGAATGVMIARATLAGLERIFPVAERLGGIEIDARVLGFAVLAAVVTAVLSGLAPAVQLTKPNLVDSIKTGDRGSRGSAVRLRTRKLLVVGQVALAVVLSVGAGLLSRSLLAALNSDPGFLTEHVVIAPVLPPDGPHVDLAQNARLLRDVTERLGRVPGVQAAGAVDSLPFGNPDSWAAFYRDDRPIPPPSQVPTAMKATVTPGYFQALGIPLVRGRLFDGSDGRMTSVKRDMPSLLAYVRSVELVAVINETMARRFWPGEDPIGRYFRWGPPSIKGPRVKILGIVGDNRQFGLDRPAEPQYFFSTDQFPLWDARIVVRTAKDLSGLAATIRETVAEYQPDAVVTNVESMETVVNRTLSARQNNAALLGLFSGIALVLAALGLYGTMAYAVAQRTQEIGVRMALGAAAGDVRMMVVREGAILAGGGVLIGVIAALAGGRAIASMLYGITATDAVTYTGSAVLLVLVMLAASYIPACRASRVDPIVALHSE